MVAIGHGGYKVTVTRDEPISPDKPAGEALKVSGGLRYVGEMPTDEQRRHVRQSELYQHGDAWLVWVNEGDLHRLSIDALIAARTPPPSALDDEVERLGEALYALSAHLQVLGLLKNDAFHEDYEKVVAAFQPLLTRLK